MEQWIVNEIIWMTRHDWACDVIEPAFDHVLSTDIFSLEITKAKAPNNSDRHVVEEDKALVCSQLLMTSLQLTILDRTGAMYYRPDETGERRPIQLSEQQEVSVVGHRCFDRTIFQSG